MATVARRPRSPDHLRGGREPLPQPHEDDGRPGLVLHGPAPRRALRADSLRLPALLRGQSQLPRHPRSGLGLPQSVRHQQRVRAVDVPRCLCRGVVRVPSVAILPVDRVRRGRRLHHQPVPLLPARPSPDAGRILRGPARVPPALRAHRPGCGWRRVSEGNELASTAPPSDRLTMVVDPRADRSQWGVLRLFLRLSRDARGVRAGGSFAGPSLPGPSALVRSPHGGGAPRGQPSGIRLRHTPWPERRTRRPPAR